MNLKQRVRVKEIFEVVIDNKILLCKIVIVGKKKKLLLQEVK
jgi:hypothetical protein